MSDFAGAAAAAAIRAALERCGAGAAFGLPGGANRILFQELRGARPRLIVPTHELAAAFMAGTYGRIDGRPGVLLTIPGPGFAYAVPGIAEAWQDSAPLLHIVSASPPGPHQRHRHQALDQRAIIRPLVKAVFAVQELQRLGETIGAAFEAARSAEPGPVIVQLGADSELGEPRPADVSAGSAPSDPRDPARAIWMRISRARKPVLLLGQGCVHSAAAIRAYVERTGTPVLTTPSGRGVVSEDSPWCLGFDSLRESIEQLNGFLGAADLVIALGARLAFNGTAGFGLRLPADRLVHVDASVENLDAVYRASSTAALRLQEFIDLPESASVGRSAWTPEELAPWRVRISGVRSRDPEPAIAGGTAEEFFSQLRAELPDDAIVVTDSGLHQILARRYFEVRQPHGLLLPTDLQSMGFALPSAIAARLAAPARRVIALLGDGGALMSGLEMATAVREKIALTVVIFNDGYLNQIRMQQLHEGGPQHGVRLPDIDFQALAAAVGARYVAGSAAVRSWIGESNHESGVTLVDVPVTDGIAVTAASAKYRAKAVARQALGSHWDTLKRLLRRS